MAVARPAATILPTGILRTEKIEKSVRVKIGLKQSGWYNNYKRQQASFPSQELPITELCKSPNEIT